MTKLERAIIPPEELELTIVSACEAWDKGDGLFRNVIPEAAPEDAHRKLREIITEQVMSEEVFKNDQYQVSVRRESGSGGTMTHLSVRRIDREAVHDWRDLQEIKNQIVGPEEEAVELYPAESRVVDTANQYHLWSFSGIRWPFGFEAGRHVSDASIGRSVNRPR